MEKIKTIKTKMKFAKKGVGSLKVQIILHIILWITVFVVVFPFLITILFSLKSLTDFDRGFWSFPEKLMFSNYKYGLDAISTNMLNSILVCSIICIGSVLMSSLCAYVFTRHKFIGKNLIFSIIIALMVVPGVLTLTPSYLNISNLGLKNSWWAVILPGLSGNQVGAIFLFRTFMSQHPDDLYESAKIDGAGDLIMYFYIALPLSIAIIIIQFINVFSAQYNDYMWPMLVIDKASIQMLMPKLKELVDQAVGSSKNPGVSYAMYLVSGIPLIFTSAIGLKYFISGEFASGLKL